MIAIVDYDAGNLRSVEKALNYIGQEAIITRNQQMIHNADKVILPGVGSFGDAITKLHHYHLVEVIKEVIEKKKPFLGICLGLQLLFEESEENIGVKGLGILDGKVLKIPKESALKIPHVGWNSIEINPETKLFKGIENQSYVYFVHSYYLKARNEMDVAATTSYGAFIHASVEHDNIFATQFHPEKSGDIGLQILKNFSNL